MQSILKRGTVNPLFHPKTPSPRTSPSRTSPRIRVKDSVSTKKNMEAAGKLGKYVGKTANNMFILEVEGKRYNFFRKDLDIRDEPNPTSPKRLSPGYSTADKIANDFINNLDLSIADKVINAICKRRTSKTKKSPTRTSPKRKSPSRRRSPTRKTCKDTEEISVKTGRCIQRCNDDQERNPVTNRCVKRTSRKKASPKRTSPKIMSILKTPPKRTSPIVSDLDELLVSEELPVRKSPTRVVDITEEPETRVRLKRSTPTFVTEPVTRFVTEEVEEGPFADAETVPDEEDLNDLLV